MGKLKADEIYKRIKKGRDHLAKWREDAKESYDFVASDQWSDDEKAQLEEEGRPEIVFNRTARTVNTVTGLEVQNRQEVRYIPREQNDLGVNDVLTAAAKWARDNCDAEDEESESFQDLIITGIGCTETRMDYEQDADGQIIIDRVDPIEMGYDPSSKKRNIDDARYIFREKKLSIEEFKELFPDAEPSITGEQDELFDTELHDNTNSDYDDDRAEQIEKQRLVTVTQFQYWVREPFHRVLGQDGQMQEFSTERFGKIKDQVKEMGLRSIKQHKRVYYKAFMNGSEELEHKKLESQEGYTFKFMTGMRNRNKNTWFGLVHLMKDPQRWANKWLSQILYILNSNAKGGAFVEEGAFSNPRKAEEDWSSPDALITLTAGGLAKIQERSMGQYPVGLDKLLNNALESINDVPGVSLEMMGLASRDQSGILEQQRKQSGITILAIFFDSLRRYRKEQGRTLADFIQQFISDGRLIRIVGEQGAQIIPLIRDELTYKFDVVVDDTPTSPNQKERVFALMRELIPVFQAAGQPMPPEMMDYLPLPENVIQQIKQRLAQSNQPDPVQEQAKQLELQGKDLENQETHSKTVLNFAKADKEGAVSNDEQAQADMKRGEISGNLNLQREKMLNDVAIKREKTLLDAEIKLEAQDLQRSNNG